MDFSDVMLKVRTLAEPVGKGNEEKPVDENYFEGTLVLEKLAEIDKVDEFFEAIDSDDFPAAEKLMKAAKVDSATIGIVLRKMAQADGEH
jgi:hypothetical protein